MSNLAFFEHADPVPPPLDADKAARFADVLADHPLLADDRAKAACVALAGHSPFLARLMERDADDLVALLERSPDDCFDALIAETEKAALGTRTALRAALRRARRKAAIVIALADVTGQWSVEEVTAALSRFADVCIAAAADGYLREAAERDRYDADDLGSPGDGSGLAIIAMGKYGARELNYSSDIDFVVFFDPDKLDPRTGGEAQAFAVKLTKELVAALHEPTGEGYVFRTDLRLRPDAGSTQVAVSFGSAANYYELFGQNWERAAFIKARAVAGDLAAGEAFLDGLTPFVWRKYLDFASIEDIQSILRQIHTHGRHREIAVEGHDVKLGLGGIREIEFFVQTQQLIHGGRDHNLRGRRTLEMLNALMGFGHVEVETAQRLADAYRFLRHVEHRLQMVEDQQTHRMPETQDGVAHIAAFCGFDNTDEFRAVLLGHLRYVHTATGALYEGAQLGGAQGSLVFTGVEDDPETLETLRRLGFERVSEISGRIRRWHQGQTKATRSTRSRAKLTELMPRLLEALGQTVDPDRAFYRFDDFLGGLPTGVQLFALLAAHPELLEGLAEIFGAAPRLSNYLARHPHMIDAMLDPDFYDHVPTPEEIEESFEDAIAVADGLEDVMDGARRLVREIGFRIGVQVLRHSVNPRAASAAYTSLADVALRSIYQVVTAEFESVHGNVVGGAFAILALGKLGSGEMMATSDLDLIFVYDCALTTGSGGDVKSDGARPLNATTYYTRLGQRLVNAISAPTAEGKLYDVDLRLRPSGQKGPLATRLAAFEQYHAESAWTWERLALTRARVIAGPTDLSHRIDAVVRATLIAPRDAGATRADIRDMRERLAREFGTNNPWNIKYVRGGLVDVEFIAQGLQLLHGDDRPAILAIATHEVIERAIKAKLLPKDDGAFLLKSLSLYQGFDHILRLALEGPFDPDGAPEALKRLLARVDGGDFEALANRLPATEARVLAIFNRIFEVPTAS